MHGVIRRHVFSAWGNSMIFTVEIDLTDKGVSNWTQVARTVFQYLEMLRQYPRGGLPAYLHEERKQIAQMSFQFMQEKDRGQYTRAVFKTLAKTCKNCLFFIRKSLHLIYVSVSKYLHCPSNFVWSQDPSDLVIDLSTAWLTDSLCNGNTFCW